MGRLPAVRLHAAGTGPGRLQQEGACAVHEGGAWLHHGRSGAGADVHGVRVGGVPQPLGGIGYPLGRSGQPGERRATGGGEVPHRLRDRAVAQHGQRVRDRAAVRAPSNPAYAAAPGALLGDTGRAGNARSDDRRWAALVARYHWTLYLFGAFLVYTGVRMLLTKDEDEAPGESWVMAQLRKRFPITEEFHGSSFLVNLNGRTFLTPLMVALVLVETTDLIFAVDSIPAIFAITADPFLVFTSNVFAILCLRSLYFGLAGLIERFRYLKVSLSVILALVGVKMLAVRWLQAWIGE